MLMTLQNDWSRKVTTIDRFYAKPRIRRAVTVPLWVCIKPALHGRWSQAYGTTPQEAYANWAAKEYK